MLPRKRTRNSATEANMDSSVHVVALKRYNADTGTIDVLDVVEHDYERGEVVVVDQIETRRLPEPTTERSALVQSSSDPERVEMSAPPPALLSTRDLGRQRTLASGATMTMNVSTPTLFANQLVNATAHPISVRTVQGPLITIAPSGQQVLLSASSQPMLRSLPAMIEVDPADGGGDDDDDEHEENVERAERRLSSIRVHEPQRFTGLTKPLLRISRSRCAGILVSMPAGLYLEQLERTGRLDDEVPINATDTDADICDPDGDDDDDDDNSQVANLNVDVPPEAHATTAQRRLMSDLPLTATPRRVPVYGPDTGPDSVIRDDDKRIAGVKRIVRYNVDY